MKTERIRLPGGYVALRHDIPLKDDNGWWIHEPTNGGVVWQLYHPLSGNYVKSFAASMNADAARVQLLAKALQSCLRWMETTRTSGDAGFWTWTPGDEYSDGMAALIEAGLNEQKEG